MADIKYHIQNVAWISILYWFLISAKDSKMLQCLFVPRSFTKKVIGKGCIRLIDICIFWGRYWCKTVLTKQYKVRPLDQFCLQSPRLLLYYRLMCISYNTSPNQAVCVVLCTVKPHVTNSLDNDKRYGLVTIPWCNTILCKSGQHTITL